MGRSFLRFTQKKEFNLLPQLKIYLLFGVFTYFFCGSAFAIGSEDVSCPKDVVGEDIIYRFPLQKGKIGYIDVERIFDESRRAQDFFNALTAEEQEYKAFREQLLQKIVSANKEGFETINEYVNFDSQVLKLTQQAYEKGLQLDEKGELFRVDLRQDIAKEVKSIAKRGNYALITDSRCHKVGDDLTVPVLQNLNQEANGHKASVSTPKSSSTVSLSLEKLDSCNSYLGYLYRSKSLDGEMAYVRLNGVLDQYTKTKARKTRLHEQLEEKRKQSEEVALRIEALLEIQMSSLEWTEEMEDLRIQKQLELWRMDIKNRRWFTQEKNSILIDVTREIKEEIRLLAPEKGLSVVTGDSCSTQGKDITLLIAQNLNKKYKREMRG